MTSSARSATIALVLLATACGRSAVPEPDAADPRVAARLETVHDKTVYALGLSAARDVKSFDLTPAEARIFVKGVADGLANAPQVDMDMMVPSIQELGKQRQQAASAAEAAAGAQLLARASAQPGAVTLSSGAVFVGHAPGAGETPSGTDLVSLRYRGMLRDGTVFEQTDTDTPATFAMDQILPCWSGALMRMRPGAKASLVCPSGAAYGAHGLAGKVPPGAVVSYEIELVGISEPFVDVD